MTMAPNSRTPTLPYTLQQNGTIEMKNRTFIEAERTMLDEYKTSDHFWVEAVNTACHAINHLYLHKMLYKTSTQPEVLLKTR